MSGNKHHISYPSFDLILILQLPLAPSAGPVLYISIHRPSRRSLNWIAFAVYKRAMRCCHQRLCLTCWMEASRLAVTLSSVRLMSCSFIISGGSSLYCLISLLPLPLMDCCPALLYQIQNKTKLTGRFELSSTKNTTGR